MLSGGMAKKREPLVYTLAQMYMFGINGYQQWFMKYMLHYR